ncbi:MAG: tetratricopeptide repeat protein [Candidatus Gastranaerophilales bacterium]|nr:tetratricopeptide repeat protein [Candidatus Gastranaerophilales bacterium]
MGIAPAFSYDYYESGKIYFEKGSYYKAYRCFKYVLEKDPQNINYRYYYAQSLLKRSAFEDAQSEFEKIIEIAPYSDEALLSSQAISDIQTFLSQKKAYRNKNLEEFKQSSSYLGFSSNNYIDNALNQAGKIVRWNTGSMPLKLYFYPPSGASGYRESYKSQFLAALDDWSSVLKGDVSYNIVNSAKEADISVIFTPQIADFSSNGGKTGFIAGLATPFIEKNLLKGAQIKLSTMKPNNTSFSDNEMYNVAIHELGHCLGIWGHSSETEDVMSSVSHSHHDMQKQSLTERDKNTIKILYKLTPDISNTTIVEDGNFDNSKILGSSQDRMNRKLNEAKDYVKKVPYSYLSWKQLGDAYFNLKNYNEAITNYKKAVELDETQLDSRAALGIAYIQSENYVNAISEFKYLAEKVPSNIAYSYNLALLYHRKNQNYMAEVTLKKLIKNNPDAGSNDKVQNLLKNL